MSRRAGAVSFASGLMAGLLAGEQKKLEREQMAQDRAFMNEQRTRQREQWGREDALRTDEASANAPRLVEPGQLAGPMPDGQDHQQVFKADGQVFGSEQEAQQAASRANLPSVRMQRVADTYAKHGKTNDAERYYAFAKQAREEGASDLLKAIQSSAPDIESIRGTKAGFVTREIPADALAAYDGQGLWRVPKGAAVQTYITKDDFGNDVLDHRVVKPDGTEIVQSVNLAERFLQAKPGAQAEFQDKRAATKYAIDKDQRDYRLREKEADSRIEVRAAQAEAAEARAGATRARMAGGGSGGATERQPGVFWAPKDDDKLEEMFTRKDQNSGVHEFDAQGFQFAKRLAIEQTKRNGGDSDSARAWAIQQDRRLLSEAGGDPQKHAELRAKHLQGAIDSELAKRGAANQPPASQGAASPQPPAATQSRVRMAEPKEPAPQAVEDPHANIPQAKALDAARATKAQAYQNLQKYGLVLRQKDQQGFAAAKAAYDQASAQEAAAAAEWERFASTMNVRQR